MVKTMQVIQKLINELGIELGLEGLTLDEFGYCCLEFPEKTINLEADEQGTVFAYAHLGSLPEQDREDFYAKLLEANYFCQETGGGTIGIDREANVVVLMMQTHVAMLNSGDLHRVLQNFINVAVTWSQRVESFSGAGDQTGEPRLADHPPFGLRV